MMHRTGNRDNWRNTIVVATVGQPYPSVVDDNDG